MSDDLGRGQRPHLSIFDELAKLPIPSTPRGGIRYGIRPHRPMTPEEDAMARKIAEQETARPLACQVQQCLGIECMNECSSSARLSAFASRAIGCGPHRGPQGPNEDLAQCPRCLSPSWEMRPEGEEYGGHIADCSLPRRHESYCQPGGQGHPAPDVVHGYWPERDT